MNRLFFKTLIFAAISLATTLFGGEASHHVLVTVAPHKYFVEKVAGDTVSVQLIVPTGASAHTYEPTPRQMMQAGQADIWFCTGENFEKRLSASLKQHRPQLDLVDLRRGVRMIDGDPINGSCCCCHEAGQDLHIWLSAREAKVQVATIASALANHYPEHADNYKNAAMLFCRELDVLDRTIGAQLSSLKQRLILVSHPAYAYFCRDYNLTQLPIECEGKDPTPQQMTTILNRARQALIKRIFVQPQYNSKGAILFGNELGAQVVTLDPYAEDYLQTMKSISDNFSQEDTLP